MLPFCLDRTDMLWRMLNMYREHVIAWGISPNGMLVEFWQGGNGSWTLTISKAAQACLMAVGSGGMGI